MKSTNYRKPYTVADMDIIYEAVKDGHALPRNLENKLGRTRNAVLKMARVLKHIVAGEWIEVMDKEHIGTDTFMALKDFYFKRQEQEPKTNITKIDGELAFDDKALSEVQKTRSVIENLKTSMFVLNATLREVLEEMRKRKVFRLF